MPLSSEQASNYLGPGFAWKEVELSLPLGLQLPQALVSPTVEVWVDTTGWEKGSYRLSPDLQLWPCPHLWTLDPPQSPSTTPLEPLGKWTLPDAPPALLLERK